MSISRRKFVIGTVIATAATAQAQDSSPVVGETDNPFIPLSPISIDRKHIKFMDTDVRIRSPELKNALDHQTDLLLEKLRLGAPSLQIDDFSIDESGRTVINNDEFIELLKKAGVKGNTIVDINIGCPNEGCTNNGCKAV